MIRKNNLAAIELQLFDINGRLQAVIEDGSPGEYESLLLYDGLDRRGNFLGFGYYVLIPMIDGVPLRDGRIKIYVTDR